MVVTHERTSCVCVRSCVVRSCVVRPCVMRARAADAGDVVQQLMMVVCNACSPLSASFSLLTSLHFFFMQAGSFNDTLLQTLYPQEVCSHPLLSLNTTILNDHSETPLFFCTMHPVCCPFMRRLPTMVFKYALLSFIISSIWSMLSEYSLQTRTLY